MLFIGIAIHASRVPVRRAWVVLQMTSLIHRGCPSAILVAVLTCSCTNVSHERPVISDDRPAISVTEEAVRDNHAAAAWLGYGIALATFGDRRETPNFFEREVYARSRAAKVWNEIRQKERVRPNKDLDALATVETNGFMREYVWHYLRRPDWKEPDNLRNQEFLDWKNQHLQSHTPVIDPGVRLKR
jgi:hypothetical protein